METNDTGIAVNEAEDLSKLAETPAPDELKQQTDSSDSDSDSVQTSNTKSITPVANGKLQAVNAGMPEAEGDATVHSGTDEEEGDDNSDEEGEEDSEEEDEEDGSDDDEDESEPALKYDVLEGEVSKLFERDSASALSLSSKYIVIGTHNGIIHILSYQGERIKSYRPHSASVMYLCIDETSDFIASASLDGQIVVHSLTTPERYVVDRKRPMRAIALEPNFARRSGRAFVAGGTAGDLVLHEKGWLGHRETLLHNGEGPIYAISWRASLIAWANDAGVKIYDTQSQARITYIDRPADSPRAELFRCNLHWQDDATLLIAWADIIKVARVRARPRTQPSLNGSTSLSGGTNDRVLPPLMAEITAVFKVDAMLAGIVPYPADTVPLSAAHAGPSAPSSFLVLAYTPPDARAFRDEAPTDRAVMARARAAPPELRIISRSGAELSADVLALAGAERWACNDYVLAEVPVDAPAGGVLSNAVASGSGSGSGSAGREKGEKEQAGVVNGRCFVVLSPKGVVLVRPRDARDHVAWLVERKRFEEALTQLERMPPGEGDGVDAAEIGQRYVEHLIAEGEYGKAAQLCPKVLNNDEKKWEDWIFVFAQKHQLQSIIPFIPTETPRLSRLVYEMVLAHFLTHDRQALLRTVKNWPNTIYDVSAVIVAIQSELKQASTSNEDAKVLMECLAGLYLANRQPGKALPYALRLRWPNVFDLIRTHNLFTDVQDQALLLVEFDQELEKKRREEEEALKENGNLNGKSGVADHKDAGRKEVQEARPSPAIALLVDHTFSIPVPRVVQQLQSRPYFLYLYLDALAAKDALLAADYADAQVELYAEFEPRRLVEFLRASNYYSLEKAYAVCKERDYVPEMVFLLGRMGNNRQALTLIIERLGDVQRAIDFAKEQNDYDLWEDLLRYSESRPAFIRGLLENLGGEIDPVRLIRRIKNGLEIPGLKPALVRVLHAFHLQISLLEGCRAILAGDAATLAQHLQRDQSRGFCETAATKCMFCGNPLHQSVNDVTMLFLCRHVVHLRCVRGGEDLSWTHDPVFSSLSEEGGRQDIGGKIAFAATIRGRLGQGCPVCHRRDEGERT